jgi:hypothetical protein
MFYGCPLFQVEATRLEEKKKEEEQEEEEEEEEEEKKKKQKKEKEEKENNNNNKNIGRHIQNDGNLEMYKPFAISS